MMTSVVPCVNAVTRAWPLRAWSGHHRRVVRDVDRSGDLEACVALYVATFALPPWDEVWEPDDVRVRLADLLDHPRSVGVAATDPAGRVRGFALGHRERIRGGDQLVLDEMVVGAREQRTGVGSELLAGLEDRVPDVVSWRLLTLDRSPASAFYARHGFRPAGRVGVWVRT